jgi:hypothetical protein
VPELISFPNLLEAKRVSKSLKEEPKHSVSVEFEPSNPDLGKIKAEIGRVAAAKWPGLDIGQAIKAGDLVVPLTSGDKLAAKAKEKGKSRDWSIGRTVLTARSQFEPQLSAVENGKLREFEGAARPQFKQYEYTGVKGLVQVNLQAYDAVGETGKPGVTAYLNMVCVTEKGPRLAGGGQSAKDVFKAYVGQDSNEDPTGGDTGPSTAW